MADLQMGAVERRFAELIWANEPITAVELAKKALSELEWKKTTAYTALKRLCDKGIFQNQGGTVTSVISREEFDARQSEKFLTETFDGSLPAFIAAFTSRRSLTARELAQIRQMLDAYEQGGVK